MKRTTTLLAWLALPVLSSCGPAEGPAAVPPVTAAPAKAAPPRPAPSPSPKTFAYSGHGAESVPPEVLARFAPTPIPGDVSRRIQAMLDVRAPIGSALAPDGRSLFFAWNVTGTYQVWKADGPRRFPVQLTGGDDVARVAGVSPDGKWLFVLKDRKGEENPGLYVISAQDREVAFRTIKHAPKVQTFLELVSDDSKWAYFRANDKKPDSYAIYKVGLDTGNVETVFAEDGLWSVDDHEGSRLLLSKATGALTSEKWEYDERTKALTPLFGQGEKEEYDAAYAKADGEVLVRTSKFGDFRRLYRGKPKKGGGPLEQGDVTAVTPDVKHDVSSFSIDRPRKTVYLTFNEGGYTRAQALDARTFAPRKLPELPKADHVTFGRATPDGRYVVVNVSDARTATTSHVLDWQTQKLTQWIVPSTPEIDTKSFAVPTLESYTARDGAKIPMFVRRPKSCGEPCPVIVHFHGGPESQARPGMSTYGQIFVDAGFVWVEPNVRGSDGYGRTWLHADDGPKRLAIITDIEDAAKHVRAAFAKDGRPPKIGVFGGSYGGYSTLMAMTRFAGAYDAGVAIVGMSNLHTFLLNTAPYRRALRASEYGDPDKDKQALLELSPVTYIDRVNAPLLLIQGATDPRVPVGEALQMHAALEQRGVTTKMIVFPDEGHGTQKRENKVLEIGHTLDFFEAHLMGKKR